MLLRIAGASQLEGEGILAEVVRDHAAVLEDSQGVVEEHRFEGNLQVPSCGLWRCRRVATCMAVAVFVGGSGGSGGGGAVAVCCGSQWESSTSGA